MDGEIDLTGIGETTLIEMYERMDPRYAPKNCARAGAHGAWLPRHRR
jgi:hypothetical protein